MSVSIENSKTLILSLVVALLCGCVNAFAQVSNVEGLKPLEGVTIPKAQASKEISRVLRLRTAVNVLRW